MQKITKWRLDQNFSEFLFEVRHKLIVCVYGKFKSFDATIYNISNEFKRTQVNFWIDVSSIVTEDKGQDELLKGRDYLDVENHELITFVSTNIGDTNLIGNYGIEGLLTMKGISKNIQLNVQAIGFSKDEIGRNKARFKITGNINRSDWGIGWNKIIESSGIILSEEVSFDCEIELTNLGETVITLESITDPRKSLSLN